MCKKLIGWAYALLTIVILAGCGKKTQPVEGQVVFEDGTPAKELAGYLIMFRSEEPVVSADSVIREDGSFTMGTFQEGDGATLGRQRVAITPPVQMMDGPRKPSLILDKYGDFETSQLEVEIKAGKNALTFTVERAKE